jgi:Mg-chelatase subunit ChlD
MWNAYRLAMILTLLMVLGGARLSMEGQNPKLMVLLDLSESCRSQVQKTWSEWSRLLNSSRPVGVELEVLSFAEHMNLHPALESDLGRGDRTPLAQHLSLVADRVDQGQNSKVLLLSDGWSTEPLEGLLEPMLQKGQALYWKQVYHRPELDARVSRFTLPEDVAPGESFLLDMEVEGPSGEHFVELSRNGQSLGRHAIQIRAGWGRLRLRDQMEHPGRYLYEVELLAKGDAMLANNRRSRYLDVRGQGGILLISPYTSDPLANVWRASGLKVQQVLQPETLRPGQLFGVQAVVLNNTPASEIPMSFLKALVPFVELQGGGLAMLGGEHSFGSGGYYRSPVDDLLPLSLELKEDKFKISLAMGIVLDRSGSMSAHTSSGHTKMALANEGAATAVELLGRQDAITVYAVDSRAHQMIPLSRTDESKDVLAQRIRSIQSMGGGIYVYSGLEAAWQTLRSAPQANRHIVLFSDASDSEEPGDYVRLLEHIRSEKTTVSVIGLGHRGDVDAALLEDIARLGGGRMYFCDRAMDLPAIFAQETVSVARSAYLKESRLIQAYGGLSDLGVQVPHPNMIQAYNLCHLKGGASLGLATADESEDPVLAFWQRAAGKVLCFTSPLAGAEARGVLAWGKYHDFCNSWIRWLMKDPLPPGVGLVKQEMGDHYRLDLHFDDSWQKEMSLSPPKGSFVALGDPTAHGDLVWERKSPGLFSTSLNLRGGETMMGALSMGNFQWPFGPLELGRSSEWDSNPRILSDLRQLSEASGGGAWPSMDELWSFPEGRREWSLISYLCILFVVLMLLEMLAYQLEWPLAWLSFLKFWKWGGATLGSSLSPSVSHGAERKYSHGEDASMASSLDQMKGEAGKPSHGDNSGKDLFLKRMERMKKS